MALAAGLLLAPLAQAAVCEATSGAKPPMVVELYTSEGCSSCPPADLWLSTLNDQPGILPLAFHVNYWNHLGWQDRFATPATTQRQHQVRAVQKGKYVYTPQVVLNGQDHRGWRGETPATLLMAVQTNQASTPSLKLVREGRRVTAAVGAIGGASTLAGYWAVLQDGLVSQVTRGENAGETLTHDHVVSLYQPVSAWTASEPRRLQLDLPEGPQFDALRVAFVVTRPGLVQPVQGVVLQCPA
ncbi:hypothetical protein LPB72_16335 [Hydrogenophaga crassostreae]|uniref:DUF1223 domain-containing protein n=2 Tax=Hydrogenophaga crassostreae TaxID=1763535 RepID=A0A167H8D4_9BURK|nr:hypothetical protein LPB072_06850 [Hydrogenophaga crassostreae]OAD40476.1 hypothetical protein LPB72_16335 [Hydrogenophaga crassostreae]